MGIFNKKELALISELEKKLEYYNDKGIEKVKKEFNENENKLRELNIKIKNKQIDLENLVNEIEALSDEINMMSFGFYKPKYDYVTSEEYSLKIKEIRDEQKLAVKNKLALNFNDNWTVDGSKSKGTAMNNDLMKMVLRAFNNECDVLISKAKFNNIDKISSKIKKSAEQINKLNARNKISIKDSYILLKINELHLVYECALKKQEEKELLKEQREQEKEEAKLLKEIEEKKKTIIKEQEHYKNALLKFENQLLNCDLDKKEELENRISDIKEKINVIEEQIKEIDYREGNKRAGYVYVISNIGAFGQDVYKIGMTRRLEPMDRVDELGDASVPFSFDVHAMIFSDDAPKLEKTLHNAFEKNKINYINGRKEFFKVNLEEIESVVKNNHDNLVIFKKEPEAIQYRETLILKNK